MKVVMLTFALLLVSCGRQEIQEQKPAAAGDGTQNERKPATADDETQIEEMLLRLYNGMERAYNDGGVDSDSLINANYDKDVLYITPWGWTEPIDSTKARLRNAFGHVRDYSHRIESMRVKSFGTAAYAFFILRQQYTVDGGQLDEYLPTTLALERRRGDWKIIHAHRSTDYETMQQYVALQKQRAAKKK